MGGTDQALLFARADAGCRAAKIAAVTHAHLDEYGLATRRCHDQVDLPAFAAIIAGNQPQTLRAQMRQRPVFAIAARGAGP